MKRILTFLLFFSNTAFSQEIGGETELCGFILGQYRKTVHHQLGPPFKQETTDENWLFEFHTIKPDTSVYALFKYASWDTTRIYSIELNGDYYEEMHPFYGFKLGAPREKADHALGMYHDTDTIDDPPIITQYYKNKNYSIDIDDRNRVYGIQIFGNIIKASPRENEPSLHAFKKAVVTKNVDSLLLNLAPDVKVYHKNKVISYTGAARTELKNNDSDLVKYLLSPTNSIWFVFNKEMAEGAPSVRTDNETKTTVHFYKFFDSNIISEIAFIAHAGKWKVHQIKFRDGAGDPEDIK
jgi:hypothetical protein